MTEAGLRKIDVYLSMGKVDWEIKKAMAKPTTKTDSVPDFILNEFAKNEPALTNFKHLAPNYKQHYILWITSAKREATIQTRLKESIELLKINQKLRVK